MDDSIVREIALMPSGNDTDRFKPTERKDILAEALGLNKVGQILGLLENCVR